MPPTNLTTIRGCGRRKAGGLYLSVPTSPLGKPVEHFLICPPILPTFDLPVQGQLPFWKKTPDGRDVLHLVDWIGETYYPQPVHWIEEARVLGVSRRVSIKLADRDAGNDAGLSILEALTPESKIWFAHARAHINNIIEYEDADIEMPWYCPKDIENHPDYDNDLDDVPSCIGVYWWDLDDGKSVELSKDLDLPYPERMVQVTLPCNHKFLARTRPEWVQPEYQAAIFARFPVIQLELVRGEYDEHVPVAERLSELTLSIPVMEMDE